MKDELISELSRSEHRSGLKVEYYDLKILEWINK